MNSYANSDANDTIPSTGEVVNRNDSVLVAYDDLRIVNSKLIQLKYEKDINNKLSDIIRNDSIIIRDYTELNSRLNKDCKKAIKQRNILIGSSALFLITTVLLLLVK